MPRYDAIVVGARCAGSSTAMLLARKGYRVLLVDRNTFPSDTMSTHFIHQPGVLQLKRWGLLQKIIDSNCPAITTLQFDFGAVTLRGTPPPAGDESRAFAPRRKILDKILVDAAVDAGAEVREGFTVESLSLDGGKVSGIRGHTKTSGTISDDARIVIGADGQRSFVAREVQAETYNQTPAQSCVYYSYWSSVPCARWDVHVRPNRAFGALPTNDGLTLVLVGWTNAEFHEYRSDIEGNFLKTLELHPGLAASVRAGKREERFIGTADLPNFFRKPYGDGWALVGDAGYHKDPCTAQGITDAFRDAELLTEAIDAGFSGRRDLEPGLADYQRLRDEEVTPLYGFTCQLASFQPPPPEMQQLFAALANNQAETDRFFGAIAGTVSLPSFFAPENVQRILQSASSLRN
jgi:flavin-dependent dehydrogenase